MAEYRVRPKSAGYRRRPLQSLRGTVGGIDPAYAIPDQAEGPYLNVYGPLEIDHRGSPVDLLAFSDPLFGPGVSQIDQGGSPVDLLAFSDPLSGPGPSQIDQGGSPVEGIALTSPVVGSGVLASEHLAEQDSDLLLHFDGGEASGTFVDSSVGLVSAGAKTVTANGGVVQRTAAAALGSTSGGRFDGVDDYLSLADDPGWDILQNGGDFFIEIRTKTNDNTGNDTFVCHRQDNNNFYEVFMAGGTVAGDWGFLLYVGGSAILDFRTGAGGAIPNATYTVLGIERWLGVLYLYKDGAKITSTAFTRTDVFTGLLLVGSDQYTGDIWYLNGDMDEVRIQRGPYSRGRNYTPRTTNWTH